MKVNVKVVHRVQYIEIPAEGTMHSMMQCLDKLYPHESVRFVEQRGNRMVFRTETIQQLYP